MIIQKNPDLHLTYCLNVHPGERWTENLAAIRDKALAVKSRVAPDRPFGLGLRLSHQAACELSSPKQRSKFRDFLKDQQLYVFTINGFPYGRFHGPGVKEKVYQPDWRSTERRDYTILLSKILSDLLPDGLTGSISTVPCSFKPWVRNGADGDQMVKMLMDCVVDFADLRRKTGKEIHFGLEPEPGCYLESTGDFLTFFNDKLLRLGREFIRARLKCGSSLAETFIRRHLGVCLDTCHLALQFEDLEESVARYQNEGVRISKIQLSAALVARSNAEGWQALQPFCEPVYLHQVTSKIENRPALRRSGYRRGDQSNITRSWNDLPEALPDLPLLPECTQLRVHFHVPLFWKPSLPLGSTGRYLTPGFFQQLKSGIAPHLEIETYTFDVLPDKVRAKDVVNSVVQEYEWVMKRMS